jgi:molecular chaperone GrpE (heat shock protein)
LRLEHHVHFLVEVLERMNVVQMPASSGKLDKLIQKAVSVENTSIAEEDQTIVRTVKLGFMWKDRMFRPEEVVIRKFTQNQALPEEAVSNPPEAPSAS